MTFMNEVISWLGNSALSGAIILMTGIAASQIFRNPARRQRMGELAVLGAVAAMLITAFPGAHMIFLRWLPAKAATTPLTTTGTFHIGLPVQHADTSHSVAVTTPTLEPHTMPMVAPWRQFVGGWPNLLTVAYLLGVVIMAGRLVLGWAILKRASNKAIPLSIRQFPSLPQQCRSPCPWSRAAVIGMSEQAVTPTAFGIFHTVILIPRTIADNDSAATRMALAHEMAHITRGDTISRILIAIAGILLFYQPLFWFLQRRIRLNQEFLADQAAAGMADSPGVYIQSMLTIARSVHLRSSGFLPAVGLLEGRSDFYLRMHRLLAGSGESRSRSGPRWCSCAAAGMTLVILPASMLSLGAPPNFAAPQPATPNLIAVRLQARRLIRHGLSFLAQHQESNGAWLGRYGPAVTALAVRGFVEAGIPMRNVHVQRALRFIERSRHADGGFYNNVEPDYNTAIVLRTLSMLPGNRYRRQARRGLAFLRQRLSKLRAVAHINSGWYSGRSILRELMKTPGYLSTPMSRCVPASQINAGLPPSCMELDPAERSDNTILSQYGRITYAQLKSMIYAGLGPHDPRVVRLSRWISGHYTLADNPSENSSMGVYYYYLVFAQTLGATGRSSVLDSSGVRHNWRRDLVRELARRCRPGGFWRNTGNSAWLEGKPVMATTYAVLALDQVVRK